MISPEHVHELARELHSETIRIRRHLHMHPELSFEEGGTAAFIADELEMAGIPHETGVGGNGVVGTIEGDTDAAIALRADFDALPIREETNHGYGSRNDGVMHACGHDGHTASLLAAGRILASLRPQLPGIVKLIFQPAEERVPGGAKPMIDAGVLEGPRVRNVFGQHVNHELPAGTVGFNPGLFMASADDVFITVHGRGGHAAKPHQGVDPIVTAANLIVTLQQIVSRNADPIIPSVLTFGRILGEGANNVIPDRVELAGTFRTLDEQWRGEALDRIEHGATALVAAAGGDAEVRIVRGYPAVVNDADATRLAREQAVAYLGEEHVVDLPPAMWGEDFAYFGLERPSCFYNLGVRNEERGIVHPVHTSRFDMDEDALRIGSGLMAWIAVGALEQTPAG